MANGLCPPARCSRGAEPPRAAPGWEKAACCSSGLRPAGGTARGTGWPGQEPAISAVAPRLAKGSPEMAGVFVDLARD